MTAVTESEFFDVTGGLRFRREGYTTPVDIPASGVLTVSTTSGASITLGGGGATTLRGINYVDQSGNVVGLDQDAADVKVFRAAPGVVITVAHNATEDLEANAIAAEQRIVTSSGNDFTLGVTNAQAFYSWVQIAGGFRWYFADERAFAPTTPADWSPEPASIGDALDQLATRSGPILRALEHGTTSGPSKSDADWATLDEMSVAAVPCSNGSLDLEFEGTFFADPTLADTVVEAQIRYSVDGAPVPNSTRTIRYQTPSILALTPGEVSPNVALPKIRVTGLGATADVAVEWSVTAGTLVALGTERSLRIEQPAVP